MAAVRTFLRKYWILIVIVLWVIAWFNRDWLAGGVPTAQDMQPEEPVAAETAPPAETVMAKPAPAVQPAPAARVSPEPAIAAAPAERAAVPTRPLSEPAPQPPALETPPAQAAPAQAAQVLARARSAQRERGPRAAAQVIAAGLQELPADAPGRPDLYGEMGNFLYLARDFAGALNAYDAALRALPEAERGSMVERLAPMYDRFHPAGRSHLEQFR